MKQIVYQLLPRLWGNGRFSGIDRESLRYFKSLGADFLWYTGIIRHATTKACGGCRPSHPQIVKGDAGSPYAIKDYYDVNPYLADDPDRRMEEFLELVDRTHKAGMKVLIDFVPNHVARDYHSTAAPEGIRDLGADDNTSVHWAPENDFYYYPGETLRLPEPFNGPAYYEYPAKASGNCFSPAPAVTDWYETIRLNYCDFHTRTWDKMYAIVRYWALKGVDGFRCDMVEMVPPQFMKWLIARIKAEFPEMVFIAEVYEKEKYRLYVDEVGFDLLYDKSGLYDTLRSIVTSGASAKGITRNWQSLGDLQPRMLNFLENHDEVRFASDFYAFDGVKTFAPLAVSLLWNSSPFMIYSGGEIGERGMDVEGFSGRDGRTSIFDWWSPSSFSRLNAYIHRGKGLEEKELSLLERFRSIFAAAGSPVFSSGSSYDLCWCNDNSPGFNSDRHFAFLRSYRGETMLVAVNFSSERATMNLMIPADATGCGNCTEEISVPAWDFTCKRMIFH